VAQGQLSHLLRYIRRLAGAPVGGPLTDGQLLELFVSRREEAAYTALLRRHGPMVLGVCRRVLGHEQDAEDAFQATFLVLARKAGSIRGADSVASWLCRIAYRMAVAAQARAARQRVLERVAACTGRAESVSDPAVRELRLMLDEELNHLPRKYHAPLVLCYLEGKTHDEAARALRWPVGTLKGRLARGREMLRRRLTRRGLSFWSGLIAALFLEKTAGAAVPAALFDSTAAAAVLCMAGAADAGIVSATVVALVEGGTKAMFLTQLKLVAAVVLAVGLLGTGVGLATHRMLAACQTPRGPTGETRATAEAVGLPDPAGKAADDERVQATLTGHTGAVLALAYSPKGKLLATGSADKTVRLWDVRTRKEVVALRGHAGEVLAVAFAPDGRLVVSASADKTVKLWDPATGKERASLQHPDAATCVAFSPDGKQLATGGKDNSLRFWDVASGTADRRLQTHQDPITALVFSPDGKAVVEGSADKTVTLTGLDPGAPISRIEAHADEVTALALRSDGKVVASASADKTVKLWELPTGKELATLAGHTGAVRAVAFDPTGKRLATAGDDKTVRLWDAATGKELVALKGHAGEVTSVAFDPDGKTVFTASADKTVKVWDVSK
jgi:RNA polymerase sigma factor (sigma-70 family)